MNSFLKYIIYFLLGIMIYSLLNNELTEGLTSISLLTRIMGSNEQGDHRTDYMGCQNYECHNRLKYTYANGRLLNEQTLPELNIIATELRITEDTTKVYSNEELIRLILKTEKANRYVKKASTTYDFLTCNNEPHYSSASMLGEECNHEKCCFNTKCSSQDVQNLPKDANYDGCSHGVLKKDSHCFDKNTCTDKFQKYCCTIGIEYISDNVKLEFHNIYSNNHITTLPSEIDDNWFNLKNITYNMISNYYLDPPLEWENLDKILGITSIDRINIKLDIYAFNDIF